MHRKLAAVAAAVLALFTLASTLLVGATPAIAVGEVISGTMVVSQTGDPIADVDVTVTGPNGELIAEVKSGENGKFRVELPGPGTYTVAMDPKSLPDDVELVDKSKVKRTVTVDPGGFAAVSFRLTDGSSLNPEEKSQVIQLTFEGIRFGLIIAIAAIGVSLIFGTTGLTNFAHGELVAWGAFAAWIVNTSYGAPLWLATIIAVIIGGLLGAANELAIWRPLRRRRTGLIAALVASIGLAIAMRNFLLIIVGGDTETYDVPAQTEVDLGLFSTTPRDLIAMGLCTVVLVLVGLMLQKTRIGKAMRAVADNRDLAESSGIDVNRVVLLVWILAGALAAFGGVIYGWTLDLRYDMGFTTLLLMFAAVTVGGLGSAYGALVGGILVGVIVQLSTLWVPNDVKYAAGLFVLIAVLLIRPSGLLGTKQRIG